MSYGYRARRSAFTLVELLVVIGIIAVLVGILLPSLSKARNQAALVKCLSGIKQLHNAMIFYVNENKQYLPYTGWGDFPNAGPATSGSYVADWLFDPALALSKHGGVWNQIEVQEGALWPSLGGKMEIFRCPLDVGPWNGSQICTSYIMNGAMSGFSHESPKYHPHRITEFHPGNAVLWETSTRGTANNDPSNYPQETVTFTHAGGTSVVFIDGHAETFSIKRWATELGFGPSALWCAPTDLPGGDNVGGWAADGGSKTVWTPVKNNDGYTFQ